MTEAGVEDSKEEGGFGALAGGEVMPIDNTAFRSRAMLARVWVLGSGSAIHAVYPRALMDEVKTYV
jgi:hypothetical protein